MTLTLLRNLFLGAAALAALSACKTVGQAVPPSAQLLLLQGDTTLDATYNEAAKGYLAVASQLTPALHDKLKASLLQAQPLVVAVDKGQLLAGQTTIDGEIVAASALIAQVRSAMPAAPSQ